METCSVSGCSDKVSRPGFKLCFKHWKEQKAKPVVEESKAKPNGSQLLNSTKLGERFDLPSQKMNSILSELGWINRERKGWVATSQGQSLGAVQKEHYQTGVPSVSWPDSLKDNKALLKTVASVKGEDAEEKAGPVSEEKSFRERFPATHRATDGHLVRSRAEMLVDNWLYMSGLVHAYARQLPVEEELYCDFYVPEGKVYIEYWGLEDDPRYAARKATKKDIYAKYNFNLVELSNDHIRNLDDYLPKMLLKFNIIVS
ncbi:hypothetical protein BH24DEI2_BH24DEI2_04650 [soil metagenome]